MPGTQAKGAAQSNVNARKGCGVPGYVTGKRGPEWDILVTYKLWVVKDLTWEPS